MDDNYVMGHKRMKVEESQHPETRLQSIDLKSEIDDEIPQMAEAVGPSMVKRTRGAGTPG